MRLSVTSRSLNNVIAYLIPGFFAGLVFFHLPHAAAGYRVIKWSCAGFLLFFVAALLYQRLESLRLPSSKILLLSAAAFPLSRAFSLFANGTDIAISMVGVSRWIIGLAFALLTGAIWASLDQKQKENTLLCLLIIAALASIPLVNSFSDMFHKGYIFEPAISGTFGNPNWAAGYFITVLPVAVYLLFTSPEHSKKLIVGLALLLVVCGIGASLSKTGIYAGIVILIMSFLTFYRRRTLIKYTVCFGILILVFGVIYFHDEVFLWLQPRLFIWKALLINMSDSWLIGNGALQSLRTIESGLVRVIGGNSSSYMPSMQVDFVHNDYLQAFVEGGILGFTTFLTMVILTLRKAYQSGSRISHTAGLSFLALSIFALGDSPLQVPVTFYVWWFLAAVIWYDDISTEGLVVTNTRAVKVFLLTAMVLFLAEGTRNCLGSYYWTQSGKTTTLLKQKQCLKKACLFIVENGDVHTEYAQALDRSRQYREARSQALRARAVKFDYADLYLIAECDIALKVTDSLSAWQSIADKFPCLNYPKLQLAKFYLENRQYQLAREQCSQVINSCQSVHTNQPYNDQALRIMEMIDKLPQK